MIAALLGYLLIGICVVRYLAGPYADLGRWWLVMPFFWLFWPLWLAEPLIDRLADWFDA
jgi:hypothetical protein